MIIIIVFIKKKNRQENIEMVRCEKKQKNKRTGSSKPRRKFGQKWAYDQRVNEAIKL